MLNENSEIFILAPRSDYQELAQNRLFMIMGVINVQMKELRESGGRAREVYAL